MTHPPTSQGPYHNAEIAAALDEIADILEIEDANVFRVRAYRNAARIVSELPNEASAMLARGMALTELPGIGLDLAQKIADLALSGTTPLLRQLRAELPPGLPDLLRLPSIGPKRVKLLYDRLGIETVEQLHRALKDGRVAEVRGFGERTAARLLETIEAQSGAPGRLKRAIAAQFAEPIAAYLRTLPEVADVVIAGSYRRARDTVGDIDILAASTRAVETMGAFLRYPEIARVLAQGPTRATVVLRTALQVDLRLVAPESFGSALVYFTGSKAHNIAIRAIARRKGLKISEYGVFKGRRRLAGRTEKEVYAAIGLPPIEPELRENQGEIEAAAAGTLPHLVTVGDICGDLHVHTNATDGRNSLEEMVRAAQLRGYQYVAITEHSRRLTVARGLDPTRLRRQMRQIDGLNRTLKDITVLKGIEVDILEDGNLDLPDALLADLDVVIAAVHSGFNLSRAAQTERILRALDHSCVTMLAHPTGRLIGEREPYDVDMEQVLRKAQERRCFVELNAHPDRLDLLDSHCRMASAMGVLVAINTDAHSVTEFENMRFGVGQARRGWLGRDDVLNTRPVEELRRLLARG